MTVGRPSKYTPELVEKARDYLANYEAHGDVVPSAAGLSLFLDVSRQVLYKWASEEGKEEFVDILEQINAKQEKAALGKGLTGDWNATIVKLLLGKHGYHDKQDTELTGKDGGAIKAAIEVSFVDPD